MLTALLSLLLLLLLLLLPAGAQSRWAAGGPHFAAACALPGLACCEQLAGKRGGAAGALQRSLCLA
jgi:hypothetical protein